MPSRGCRECDDGVPSRLMEHMLVCFCVVKIPRFLSLIW